MSHIRCPRHVRNPALVVAAIGAVLLPSSEAFGQQVNWTHTQIASVNGAMPSIEVDRLGYVHVGWTLGMGGSSYYAYHVSNQTGAYALTLVDSKTASSAPYYPFLTTDSLGLFHMAWRDLSLSGGPVFYRTNNPETRASVKKSFSSSGHVHDVSVDVTGDDVAHIIAEADACSGCATGSNLYDESFAASAVYAGPVSALTQDLADTTGLQQFSSIATSDGARHLVFSMRLVAPADTQRLIYYSNRAAGSLTWSTPTSITGHDTKYQGWPGIVADANGKLHVVYSSEDNGIYYLNNKTGTWSTPVRINDQITVTDSIPSITADRSGRLHVVFQRYTPVSGQPTVVSLHYTTNAFDANTWLAPAPRVMNNVTTFQLTHQNRKVAVNWVHGQVLVPYQSGTTMWLASTTDVPVMSPDAGGTSTLRMTAGFTPPTEISRTTSNTSATATTVLKVTIADTGSDAVETRIRAIHVNAGGLQSYTRVAGKDEGLSYLISGAQLVTGAGQVITGLVSDTKMVFRDVNHNLWVPNGGAQTYDLKVWMTNQAYVTGKTIELRIKPDQDVVHSGSVMVTGQAVVTTAGVLVVETSGDASVPSDGPMSTDGGASTDGAVASDSSSSDVSVAPEVPVSTDASVSADASTSADASADSSMTPDAPMLSDGSGASDLSTSSDGPTPLDAPAPSDGSTLSDAFTPSDTSTVADASTPGDGSAPSDGKSTAAKSGGGCGCFVGPGSTPAHPVGFLSVLLLLALVRRKRAR